MTELARLKKDLEALLESLPKELTEAQQEAVKEIKRIIANFDENKG